VVVPWECDGDDDTEVAPADLEAKIVDNVVAVRRNSDVLLLRRAWQAPCARLQAYL